LDVRFFSAFPARGLLSFASAKKVTFERGVFRSSLMCRTVGWGLHAALSVLLLVSRFLFSSRLPGGGITFFAAAKKVIKESSFSTTPKACLR
jgi:hypothetical protein